MYEKINQLALGMFAFPMENAVVRIIPVLNNYARSKEARNDLNILLNTIAQRRRAALARGEAPAGILDTLLQSNLPEEEVLAFAIDNTVLSIFAGFDTTASTLANVLLILHDSHEAREAVRQEIQAFLLTNKSVATAAGALNIWDQLPDFKSVVLESSRRRPAVAGVFRKTSKDISLGKSVSVPAGTTLSIGSVAGSQSPALYEEPKKDCPLRFLHASSSSRPEPEPPLFGFGKHMCPGQHLAQVEM